MTIHENLFGDVSGIPFKKSIADDLEKYVQSYKYGKVMEFLRANESEEYQIMFIQVNERIENIGSIIYDPDSPPENYKIMLNRGIIKLGLEDISAAHVSIRNDIVQLDSISDNCICQVLKLDTLYLFKIISD